ncbi:hypothetical protein CCACVL1_20265 [Corchorus capsularis]|uniref:Aminotransferase-like plant mobile domain-containing protein n=1 Tax=Corchorus capsularis TaxID=210143 RepID=A0A1R3HC17_COCAP|nr:hypothetical protein CCACVL1_20265 [Corchorus capsularis]
MLNFGASRFTVKFPSRGGDGSSSGARHTRSRNVTASVRRDREEQLQRGREAAAAAQRERELAAAAAEQAYFDGAGRLTSFDSESHSHPYMDLPLMRGRGGRFTSTGSTSGSSKRSRRSRTTDADWVVRDPVPGGLTVGDVIPSFLGHVASLEGQLITWDLDFDPMQFAMMEVLDIPHDVLNALHYDHVGVLTESIFTLCNKDRMPETQAIAWVWILLGSTLFCDKSGNRIRPSCMLEVKEGLENVPRYSWGAATLAYLYHPLRVASRGDCQGIAGCMTLLQAWIYEYIPCFRPPRVHHDPRLPRCANLAIRAEGRSEDRLSSLRSRLDQMVTWLPYGRNPHMVLPKTTYTGFIQYRDVLEVYYSTRVLRQLGFVQTIPPPIYHMSTAVRSWSSKQYKVNWPQDFVEPQWNGFPHHCMLPVSQCESSDSDPSACDPEYMDWYVSRSHPRLVSIGEPSSSAVPLHSNSEYGDDISSMDEQLAALRENDLARILEKWNLAE